MHRLLSMLKEQSGASAAEYAVILAIVGTGIILAALALGSAVSGSMSDAAHCIATAGGSC